MTLKPCPRCGGKAQISLWSSGWGCFDRFSYFGHCVKRICYVMGPMRRTKAAAGKAWNEIGEKHD